MKKLVVVVTFVAGAAVGFTACGAIIASKVLKSDRHREGLAKVVTEKLDTWLYDEEKPEIYRSPKYNTTYVSYRDFHNNRYDEHIIFETREEADGIFNNIVELLNEHGSVTVADVCDLCGQRSTSFDSQRGWKTTEDIKVVKTRNGYELYLPKPVEL
jgi:hypothetical protein